jgi:ribulose-phosphate 3-epimerase
MIQIIPSILTNDVSELKEMLATCEGVVDRVSIDVIDGKFAKNRTVDPSVLVNIDTNLKIDYQLMVIEPSDWIEKCLKGKADRIIGHVEHMANQADFIRRVQDNGATVGLALDLFTPASSIDPLLLNKVQVVLAMSVSAGFGGQKFDPSVLQTIGELDRIRAGNKLSFNICVDGGVAFENIGKIQEMGGDEVVIGRSLFAGNMKTNIEEFRKMIQR